jgi:hypothetical protein
MYILQTYIYKRTGGKYLDKYELIEKMSKLGGNYKPHELRKIKGDMQAFLAIEDCELLRDYVCCINAILEYTSTGDNTAAYKIAKPIFDKLADMESWSFYYIMLALIVFTFADNFEETYLLTKKALEEVENFKDNPKYLPTKMCLNLNLSRRLVEAKFADPHYMEQPHEIEDIFAEAIENAIAICKELENDLMLSMANIRNYLFHEKYELVDNDLDEIKAAGQDVLYTLMLEEVKRAMHSRVVLYKKTLA